MQLRTKTEVLERWGHASHYITLVLVAIASLAGLATLLFPPAQGAETWLDHALHATHLIALTLALIHVSLLLLFSRNVGKQIAKALSKKPLPTAPATASVATPEKQYKYRALEVSTSDVQFVDTPIGNIATTLFAMNREIFEGSAFEMKEDQIRERNTALINRNGNVFMLVRNPLREVEDGNSTEDLIGFTCVLPLNETGADCYLNGVIRDRDMRASLVCAKGEPCDTLLVFAIGLKKKYRENMGLRVQYYHFLLRCAEHHVNAVATAHHRTAGATVWAVSEYDKLEKHFQGRGFECKSDKKSADGFLLYSRELPPPSAQPSVQP